MKRTCALLLALAMVLSLAACGGTTADTTAPVSDTPAPQSEAPATETPAPETEEPAGMSETVQQLYAEFDAAMEEQIGPMPENYGDVKVGAVIIS